MGNLFSFSPRAQFGDVNNNLTIRGPFISSNPKSSVWQCLDVIVRCSFFVIFLWLSYMIRNSHFGKMAVSAPFGVVWVSASHAALLALSIAGLVSIIDVFRILAGSRDMRIAAIIVVSSSVLLSLVNYMGWFNQNTLLAWDEYVQAFR